ncbi:MAG TPA: glycogen-binding domain-containing protein, partial [Gemmatimonadaceae bacterium]|nr:glycogen-binding domain-containing protein [Gemmatimonadaceae bacterium]
VLALSAALLIPHGIRAQTVSKLEAGSLIASSADGSGVPNSVFRIAPDVLITRPNASLAAAASAWLLGQQWQLVDGSVSGTVTSPTVYGVRTELLGGVSRAFEDQSLGSNQVDVATRVSVPIEQASGVWVGGGVARPWKIATVSAVDLMDGGAWTRIGNATFTTTFTNQRFTKAARTDSSGDVSACVASASGGAGIDGPYGSESGTTGCSHGSSVSDLESSVRWQFSRVELTGTAGYRFGDALDVEPDSRRWATGTATVWVSTRLAIVAGGGRQPADIQRNLPARSFGSLGMQVAYWPSWRDAIPVGPDRVTAVRAFDIRPDDGLERITIRVGSVEQVEVAGDFTDWEPVTLTRHGRDMWDITLPIAPGVYTIDVRVDHGPWFAPPGLPTMRDGFGGQVGKLLIEK